MKESTRHLMEYAKVLRVQKSQRIDKSVAVMADIAASVLAKLNAGISYQQCLQRFMQEELLRKLSKSGYDDFLQRKRHFAISINRACKILGNVAIATVCCSRSYGQGQFFILCHPSATDLWSVCLRQRGIAETDRTSARTDAVGWIQDAARICWAE